MEKITGSLNIVVHKGGPCIVIKVENHYNNFYQCWLVGLKIQEEC